MESWLFNLQSSSQSNLHSYFLIVVIFETACGCVNRVYSEIRLAEQDAGDQRDKSRDSAWTLAQEIGLLILLVEPSKPTSNLSAKYDGRKKSEGCHEMALR